MLLSPPENKHDEDEKYNRLQKEALDKYFKEAEHRRNQIHEALEEDRRRRANQERIHLDYEQPLRWGGNYDFENDRYDKPVIEVIEDEEKERLDNKEQEPLNEVESVANEEPKEKEKKPKIVREEKKEEEEVEVERQTPEQAQAIYNALIARRGILLDKWLNDKGASQTKKRRTLEQNIRELFRDLANYEGQPFYRQADVNRKAFYHFRF
jgi:hypothetical protein